MSKIILADLVQDINAKLQELQTVLEMHNVAEALLEEDDSEFNSEIVESMFEETSRVINERLGTNSAELDSSQLFQGIQHQVMLTLQLDRLCHDLKSIGASDIMEEEFEKLKILNLNSLSKSLNFDLEEVLKEEGVEEDEQ